MAELPAGLRESGGRIFRPTESGQWEEVSPEEAAAAETSNAQAWLAQGGRNLSRAGNFLAMSGLMSGTADPQARRQGMNRINQLGDNREALMAPLDEVRPGASLGGQMVLDPLNVVGSQAVKAASTMSSRVLANTAGALRSSGPSAGGGLLRTVGKIGDAIQTPINNIAREQGAKVGAAVNKQMGEAGAMSQTFGDTSVGAAQFGDVAEMSGMERAFFEMLAPERLTPDQQSLLDSGIAERLGLNLIPGQESGVNVLKVGAESDPLLGKFVGEIMEENLQQYEGLIMTALRQDGVPFSTDALSAARKQAGGLYDQAREMIPPGQIPDELRDAVRAVYSKKEQKLLGWSDDEVISGADLLTMYRSVRNIGIQQAKSGKQAKFQEVALKVSADLRDFLWQHMGDDAAAVLGNADEMWLLEKMLEKPGVIRNGRLSWKTLGNVLTREMPEQYRRQLMGPREGRSGAFTDVLDATRFFNAFESNINDSGTAMRQSFREMITSPATVPARLAGREFLLGLVDEIDPATVRAASP